MREPALIGLAESGQLTGKILKLRLMVTVLASDCPTVNVAAANQLICLTSQAEGCSLERWNAHKGFLKANFHRLVQEVKAQRRAEQEKGDQSGQQHTGAEGCVCVMYPTESRLQPDVKRFTPQVIASVYCTYSS